jgi:zinc protease
MRTNARFPFFATVILAMALFLQSLETLKASPVATAVSEFELANGLHLVVVPDTRAPVVTHFVWYRAGSADEPPGVSGVAHFLEHLMFKSTDAIPSGGFSRTVARLGGQDNAFTNYDYTGYFQRIPKEQLQTVMRMEADRMVNLKLTEAEVATEREVIIEERRSRIENNPAAILGEQMTAALYQNHPYRVPVMGWMHELHRLSREDALAFYQRYYAPNNAVVVVVGDVVPEEVEKLAQAAYGALPANTTIPARHRPQEPEQRCARRVELKDPRAGNASVRRLYLAPSYLKAEPGEAEALHLLMKIAGFASTSRLYQHLVVDAKVATGAGAWYSGAALDSGTIGVYAVAAPDAGLDTVEAAIDRTLHELREALVSPAELERAKRAFIAEFIYEIDSQQALARRYGEGRVLGQTIAQINDWPSAIAKVTAQDLRRVANKYLDIRRSVTGTLLPAPSEAESDAVLVPSKKS